MKHSAKKQMRSLSVALRQLLLEGTVDTQETICSTLTKQGFSVNQSKISRLLNKIGAIKVKNPQGQTLYRLPHEHGLAHELQHTTKKTTPKQWVIDIVDNGAIIVIHTTPGAAALVARELDLHHLELFILGSIAGDDTIFVAPKEVKHIQQALERIKKLLIE